MLGLFIVLFSPVEYSTEATLMPEMKQEPQGRAGSLLQQYGGMLGIGAGDLGGQAGTIPPQLYPNIVQSLPYQVELMNTEVYFSAYDTTATVHEFFNNIYSPSVLGYLKQITIGIPGQITKLYNSNKQDIRPLPNKTNRDSILSLNKEQMETVEKLRKRLIVTSDQETGVLTLRAQFPDPQAVAEIGQAAIGLLKENVKEYRTQKARQNLEFVKEQVQQARKRFEEAQQRLAEFRDSNQNLATAKAQSREQELQSQYDLTFNLYNSLSQRKEQAKLDLQEETPVLSVLQPVSVPLEKSSPNTLLIIIGTVFLGFLISLGWIFIDNRLIN